MTPWEEETKIPCFTFPLTLPFIPFSWAVFLSVFFLKAAIPWIYTKRKPYFVKINAPQCSLLHQGFPGGSGSKESACGVGDLGSISGLERSPGGEDGNPLQYSCYYCPQGQSPRTERIRQATIQVVAKSQAELNN